MSFILKGFFVGLIIAVPVGPVGVLCLYRTLTGGRIYGLVSGLGAAIADALYGFVAVAGVSYIYDVLSNEKILFRLFSSIVFIFIGIKIVLGRQIKEVKPFNKSTLYKAFVSAFILTLTNPATIIAFIAVFAILGVVCSNPVSEGELVAGIFFGSAFWWLVLSSMVQVLEEKMNSRILGRINKACGSVIIVLGLIMFFWGIGDIGR